MVRASNVSSIVVAVLLTAVLMFLGASWFSQNAAPNQSPQDVRYVEVIDSTPPGFGGGAYQSKAPISLCGDYSTQPVNFKPATNGLWQDYPVHQQSEAAVASGQPHTVVNNHYYGAPPAKQQYPFGDGVEKEALPEVVKERLSLQQQGGRFYIMPNLVMNNTPSTMVNASTSGASVPRAPMMVPSASYGQQAAVPNYEQRQFQPTSYSQNGYYGGGY